MLVQANALYLPLKSESVQCVVTSPPYWGLRDYGTARWEGGEAECEHKLDAATLEHRYGRASTLVDTTTTQKQAAIARHYCKCGARRIDSQLGLERTPEEYVTNMVQVFREVWRVLRRDGTCWVNLGDSYAGAGDRPQNNGKGNEHGQQKRHKTPDTAIGLKPKDLVGIPWRVAFALQADGWYLRSDIIWSKPNPMPESVTDRPTKSHEYVFLLSKSERYYYDADAIAEPATHAGKVVSLGQKSFSKGQANGSGREPSGNGKCDEYTVVDSRNKRSVWHIATQPYNGAHFATFPEKLVEPCILAGSKPGDLVLDPFVGSGTVVRVARRWQRQGIGCDISLPYLTEQAEKRTSNVQVKLFAAAPTLAAPAESLPIEADVSIVDDTECTPK